MTSDQLHGTHNILTIHNILTLSPMVIPHNKVGRSQWRYEVRSFTGTHNIITLSAMVIPHNKGGRSQWRYEVRSFTW